MEKLEVDNVENSEQNLVKHGGVVSKISKNVITVSLKGNINCEGCKAKAACGATESDGTEIEVFDDKQSFSLYENVDVILEKKLGLKAVFWAYVFPFILMIVVLVISANFLKEWLAGLISLFVLIPYYLMLYLLQDSFQKAFKVSIFKIN